MKTLFIILALLIPAAGYSQSIFAPGELDRRLDSFEVNGTIYRKGSKLMLPGGGTGTVSYIEVRKVNNESATFAVSRNGYYYPLDHNASRYTIQTTGTGLPLELSVRKMGTPDTALQLALYRAGAELEGYSRQKTASFLLSIAATGILLGTAISNGRTNASPSLGGYFISGGLSLFSIILSISADSKVGAAGKILRIASGHIPIRYKRKVGY